MLRVGGGKTKSSSCLLPSKTFVLALFCLDTLSFLRWIWFSPFLYEFTQAGQRSLVEVLSSFRLHRSFLHVFCILSCLEDEVQIRLAGNLSDPSLVG